MSVMIWELQLRVPRSAFGFEIEFFLLFLSLPGWLRFFLASIPSMALLGDKRSDRAQNHVCHRENKVHDRVFYRNDNLDELKLALLSFICCGVHWKSQQPTGYGFQEFLQKHSKVLIEKKSVLTAVERYMVVSIRLAHLAGSCSMTQHSDFKIVSQWPLYESVWIWKRSSQLWTPLRWYWKWGLKKIHTFTDLKATLASSSNGFKISVRLA